ncbi:MAG: hypothetical protein LUO85_01190 [Methanomassiliicoccales archaeon]|nr:hypothetical protein [Methanomassiliicoccales archaeon]
MTTALGASSLTPTGTITSVTASPDGKIHIGFGVVVPETRYSDCEVILLPPGDSGIDSSAQAKLWKIGQSTGFAYNSTIYVEISPPDSNEPVGSSSNHGVDNDALIINCTSSEITKGKWMIFLVYLPSTGTIAGATWIMNGTPVTNQSFAFSSTNDIDAMEKYGFYHPPWFGDWYFWPVLFLISFTCFVALSLALVSIAIQDRRRKGR